MNFYILKQKNKYFLIFFSLIFLSACEYTLEQEVVDARNLEIIFYPNPKYNQDTLIFISENKVHINEVSSWYLDYKEIPPQKVIYDGKLIFKRNEKVLGVTEFCLDEKSPHHKYFLKSNWHYKKLTEAGLENLKLLRKTKYFPWENVKQEE